MPIVFVRLRTKTVICYTAYRHFISAMAMIWGSKFRFFLHNTILKAKRVFALQNGVVRHQALLLGAPLIFYIFADFTRGGRLLKWRENL